MSNYKASNALLVERVNKLEQQRAELLEEFKVAKDALDHMWREVSMNEYDYEKLNEAIIISDSVITKAEQDLSGETNVL